MGGVRGYSDDGINWITAGFQTCSRVAYGDGRFIAQQYNSNVVLYSEDGINWTTSTTPSTRLHAQMVYGGGSFVLLNADGTNEIAVLTPTSLLSPSVGKFNPDALDLNNTNPLQAGSIIQEDSNLIIIDL
jgi:hypothetical protein